MERITPIEEPYPDAVAGELAQMMPPGIEPLRLFRVLARNPRILAKIRASNLLDRGSLDKTDRELAILRVCARCGCEYEWGVHATAFARRYGIDDVKLEATVFAAAGDPCWSDKERAIVELVDSLHDTSGLSEASWQRLRRTFAEDQIIELIVLVGFYHTISFVIGALQLELEAGAERFPTQRRPAT